MVLGLKSQVLLCHVEVHGAYQQLAPRIRFSIGLGLDGLSGVVAHALACFELFEPLLQALNVLFDRGHFWVNRADVLTV